MAEKMAKGFIKAYRVVSFINGSYYQADHLAAY
jgi:hypothetical protein